MRRLSDVSIPSAEATAASRVVTPSLPAAAAAATAPLSKLQPAAKCFHARRCASYRVAVVWFAAGAIVAAAVEAGSMIGFVSEPENNSEPPASVIPVADTNCSDP
jgi:hypothetical protein